MLKFCSKLIFICLVLAFCHLGISKASASALIIKGIKSEATAKSSVLAREVAFNKALNKAFEVLIDRMVQKSENTEKPSEADIANMMLDFEITSEQSSRTSYRATYTIRFDKGKVQSFLDGTGTSYTVMTEDSILILPFLQVGTQTILWNAENNFLKAWQNSPTSPNATLSFITPIGDLQDMMNVKEHEALTYKPQFLEQMVSRYHAGSAAILIATQAQTSVDTSTTSSDFNVYVYRTDNKHPEYIETLNIKSSSNDIFNKAVSKTKEFLTESWKNRHKVQHNTPREAYNIVVRYKNIDQWISIKSYLEKNFSPENLSIKSLGVKEALLSLKFNGALDRLNLSLKRNSYALRPVGAGFYELYQNNSGN